MSNLNLPSLGKGLAALLGDVHTPQAQQIPQSLEISLIQPGANQPRQEFNEESLADLVLSIQRKGILQPLLVRQTQPGKFEIIAGERRWRAAKVAKLERVPVVIIACNDQEALEIGLIENLQRHDLNPLEEAEAIKRLQEEFKLTQEQIASSIGKSRSYVANILRLNTLNPDIKKLIRENKLSAGHARALITAPNPSVLAEQIIQENLSVRDTEKLVKNHNQKDKLNNNYSSSPISATSGKQFVGPMDTDIQILSDQLAESLNMKVHLVVKGQGGSLTINFQNLDQLDILLSRLQGHPNNQ
ncbi:MAG: ParB/RepB/Spo0J family partition protein [Proteobacteria bacterium]|nr:ParB/RepB/Spo0J family partition protein [Pseudomonadota bacterium]